jgi:uncharacterized protein (TIGR02594 family)
MAIDRAMFAQECVREGIFFGVNPHYMLGVAELRSGISDGSSAVGQIGPFRLKPAEWNANCVSDEFDIHFTASQISSPARQCAVFALMAHRAFDAFVSRESRNPSAKELYLQQWPDTATATLDADFKAALDKTAALVAPAADAVLDDPKSIPPTLSNPEKSTDRPVPPSDIQGAPEWYKLALKEIGTTEKGDNSGEAIARYRQLAKCGQDHDPWCAIFANAMFALCAPPLPGTKSAASRSFCDNGNFNKLEGPALGAVVVFWRDGRTSGKGHVGFYRGETSDSIYVLGGNEGDMVQIQPMSKHQLIGYWWPRSVSPPVIGKIAIPPGTPRHQTKVT